MSRLNLKNRKIIIVSSALVVLLACGGVTTALMLNKTDDTKKTVSSISPKSEEPKKEASQPQEQISPTPQTSQVQSEQTPPPECLPYGTGTTGSCVLSTDYRESFADGVIRDPFPDTDAVYAKARAFVMGYSTWKYEGEGLPLCGISQPAVRKLIILQKYGDFNDPKNQLPACITMTVAVYRNLSGTNYPTSQWWIDMKKAMAS